MQEVTITIFFIFGDVSHKTQVKLSLGVRPGRKTALRLRSTGNHLPSFAVPIEVSENGALKWLRRVAEENETAQATRGGRNKRPVGTKYFCRVLLSLKRRTHFRFFFFFVFFLSPALPGAVSVSGSTGMASFNPPMKKLLAVADFASPLGNSSDLVALLTSSS